MDPQKLWKECLSEIGREIRGESFRTWLEPLVLTSLSEDTITLFTPKGEIHTQFIDDKYRKLITDTLRKLTGRDYRLVIESKRQVEDSGSPNRSLRKTLNPDYTFENFIVGQSNEFAYSAAQAVSQTPGSTKFNPLFIYGKSGLGKTHLLQAVGNFISKKNIGANVVYTTAAQFMDEYIKFIEIKKIEEFNKTYKSCDTLLVDDIQFLSGRQATQEVFFHIFNELFHNNKQIVLTSDKFPKELDGLEDRLISRFQSGLTVDILPPNFETKIAILHKKAEKNNLSLSEEVLEYIAKNSSNNIREMEGYLIKLLAYASMKKVDVDTNKAMEILELNPLANEKKIYVEQVIERVSAYYNIPKEKIIKGTREKEIVLPRQVAMYLSRKLTRSSLKNIGKIFIKDHSTIVHGCRNIEQLMEKDASIKSDVLKLNKIILEQ